MATPNRIGVQAGPFLQSVVENENTRTGSETDVVFKGSLTECQAQRELWRTEGAGMIELRNLGDGDYLVMARFPFNSNGVEQYPLASIHELDENVLQESIWNSPILLSQIGVDGVAIVRDVLRSYENGSYSDINNIDPATNRAAISKALVDLGDMLDGAGIVGFAADQCLHCFKAVVSRGLENFQDYEQVYRRTLTAATPAIVQASYVGCGMIWTSAEVESFEGLDPVGWFQLEPDLQWLKSRPKVTAVAGQKTQLTYSYTSCKKASGLVYQAYGGAVLADMTDEG